jgi:cyanophycinase
MVGVDRNSVPSSPGGNGILRGMSIFLAGAGPDPLAFPELFDTFVQAVRDRQGMGRKPRVAVVVHNRAGNPADLLPAYTEPLLERMPTDALPVLLDGSPADPSVFDAVDAVVVGGGLTPAYWKGLSGSAAAISRAVAGGAAYLGFSAGAMIAPHKALTGGYRSNGVEVCGEECSEGLDELEVRDGLGLVPFTVDVHAAQAGTLSRAVASVAAGLVGRAVAVDENTALVLQSAGDESFQVIGAGNCWDIRSSAAGCSVSMLAAG